MIEIVVTAIVTCDKCGLKAEVENIPKGCACINRPSRLRKAILGMYSRSWKRIQDKDVCGDCAKELEANANG